MPEPPTVPLGFRQSAMDAVDQWVRGLPGTRPLSKDELASYRKRQPLSGWRLEVNFEGGMQRLDLLLIDGFPRRAPQIVLVDRPEFHTWPHVEEDGVLCLLGDDAAVDHAQPVAVAQNLLAEAADLVEDLVAGRREEDFRDEFLTYWVHQVNSDSLHVKSLLTPQPPSRLVQLWRAKGLYLVGEDGEAVSRWLEHVSPGKGPRKTAPTPMLWLDRPMTPAEFPKSPSDVLALARKCGGEDMLKQFATENRSEVLVMIGAESQNGPCWAAVMLPPGDGGKYKSDPPKFVPGFRPGKAPQRLVVKQNFGGGRIIPLYAERVDAAWIHGRGQDPSFEQLRAATVAVIGCGSVGAHVAVQLAAAGIGRLSLIDPQIVQSSNIGRHPLGSTAVGRKKASALAEKIREDYPHILRVEAINDPWELANSSVMEQLATCNLIVCATGNWAAESTLDAWRRANRQGAVVYGWAEPHACAGHAAAILSSGGCLQCGFTTSGTPLCRATDWPGGDTSKREPGCGASYQPYGPVELSYVVSLNTEMALDCLLGVISESTLRTWVTRRPFLERAGGRWSESWLTATGNRIEGGYVLEQRWQKAPACAECETSSS